jgi:hypothetical protein
MMNSDGRTDVIGFLSNPASFGLAVQHVGVIATNASMVCAGPTEALRYAAHIALIERSGNPVRITRGLRRS